MVRKGFLESDKRVEDGSEKHRLYHCADEAVSAPLRHRKDEKKGKREKGQFRGKSKKSGKSDHRSGIRIDKEGERLEKGNTSGKKRS